MWKSSVTTGKYVAKNPKLLWSLTSTDAIGDRVSA